MFATIESHSPNHSGHNINYSSFRINGVEGSSPCREGSGVIGVMSWLFAVRNSDQYIGVAGGPAGQVLAGPIF